MKTSIRFGAILKCDMVTVTGGGTMHRHQCEQRFISYSVASLVREQAAGANWARARVSLVKWPGEPPMADAKKVDLCPQHAKLLLTVKEAKERKDKLKAERKAERDAARAEKKRQKAEARDVAKAVKEKAKRKRKGDAHAEA